MDCHRSLRDGRSTRKLSSTCYMDAALTCNQQTSARCGRPSPRARRFLTACLYLPTQGTAEHMSSSAHDITELRSAKAQEMRTVALLGPMSRAQVLSAPKSMSGIGPQSMPTMGMWDGRLMTSLGFPIIQGCWQVVLRPKSETAKSFVASCLAGVLCTGFGSGMRRDLVAEAVNREGDGDGVGPAGRTAAAAFAS
mmetsp:Transcript_43050/g.116075  ORF Transcript_43050/g.116075 Transcript_43050/m.116075 type:complete len:195 (-) Transcript_43050:316-900(-)